MVVLELQTVVVWQTGVQYTWRTPGGTTTDVTRFVASDVKTAKSAAPSMDGSELDPLDAVPSVALLIKVVTGMHDPPPRQVSRKKMSLDPLVCPVTRLPEMEANAMNSPFVLTEGPEFATVKPKVPLWQFASPPQIPLLACVPSGATSTSKGSPAVSVALTANVSMLDVPPRGAGLNTHT